MRLACYRREAGDAWRSASTLILRMLNLAVDKATLATVLGLCFVCFRKSARFHLRDQPRFSDPPMKLTKVID